MSEIKRNLLVAAFVLLAVVFLGWLIFKFGDLPVMLQRVDSWEISIFFPEASGIRENSEVYFCGYPVGRVTTVKSPRIMQDLADPSKKYYQVEVVVSIGQGHTVPNNTVPKVYRRGLGSSYLAFDFNGVPAEKSFSHGDKVKGMVSSASEFISENTQNQLDKLIASLTRLSEQIQVQLTILPPEQVDKADTTQLVYPNLTTAVIRLDKALKNVNMVLGDQENQQNLKKGLAQFIELTQEMRQGVQQIQTFTGEAVKLIDQVSQTVNNMNNLGNQVNQTVQNIAPRIQNAADSMAASMNSLTLLLEKISTGEGTAGRLTNDPRLYEALVDAVQNITLTMRDFREQLEIWKKYGILSKDKVKDK